MLFKTLNFGISIIGIIYCIRPFFLFKRSDLYFFNIKNLFLIAILLDVYLPCFLWSVVGLPNTQFWIRNINMENLFLSQLFFLGFCILFFSAYDHFNKFRPHDLRHSDQKELYDEHRLLIVSIIFFSFIVGSWYYKISESGGFVVWYKQISMVRWVGESQDYTIFRSFVLFMGKIGNFVILFYCLYLYSIKNCNIKFLVLLLIIVLNCYFSFFRGSFVVIFLAFAIVGEYNNSTKKSLLISLVKNRKKIFISGIIFFIFFIFYGFIRDYSRYYAWDKKYELSFSTILSNRNIVVNKGYGIIGLTDILFSYDKDTFFYGKTIKDSLLIFIPRLVWTSKPDWYGIDDITRKIGYPPSTQSAVTIPGELYANFGIIGILFGVIYGSFFGYINSYCRYEKNRLIYASYFASFIFSSHWMSTIAIMNKIILFPFVLILVRFVQRKIHLR